MQLSLYSPVVFRMHFPIKAQKNRTQEDIAVSASGKNRNKKFELCGVAGIVEKILKRKECQRKTTQRSETGYICVLVLI